MVKRGREIIEVFEKSAPSYDDWYRKPIGVYAFRSELKGLRDLLPSSGLGLDVGAGTGIFAQQLSTDERKIVCIEPSLGMLKEAKKRNLQVIAATAETFPLRPMIIDFAYMVTVIEFLPEPLKALRAIGESLKEDATLVILFINKESSWGEHYSKLAEKGDPIFSHARLYTLGDMCSLFERACYDPQEFLGTLTASPDEPGEEVKLVPISSGAGVILIKARKKRIRNPIG